MEISTERDQGFQTKGGISTFLAFNSEAETSHFYFLIE